jgi:hypothetical protein
MWAVGLLMQIEMSFGRTKMFFQGKWSKSEQMRQRGARIVKILGALDFQDSYDSAVLQQEKRFNMADSTENLSTEEIHTMMQGTLGAIVKDSAYFYHSNVGPQYSKLYPAGEAMLIKSMNTLLPLLAEANNRELDKRAKEIVIKNHKGENN